MDTIQKLQQMDYPLPKAGSFLDSAWQAAKALQQPFGFTALTIACWQMFPRQFGLPGMEHLYPHSKRVADALYGHGLLERSLVEAVGKGLYRVVGETDGDVRTLPGAQSQLGERNARSPASLLAVLQGSNDSASVGGGSSHSRQKEAGGLPPGLEANL